jgi:hypothetical protein
MVLDQTIQGVNNFLIPIQRLGRPVIGRRGETYASTTALDREAMFGNQVPYGLPLLRRP